MPTARGGATTRTPPTTASPAVPRSVQLTPGSSRLGPLPGQLGSLSRCRRASSPGHGLPSWRHPQSRPWVPSQWANVRRWWGLPNAPPTRSPVRPPVPTSAIPACVSAGGRTPRSCHAAPLKPACPRSCGAAVGNRMARLRLSGPEPGPDPEVSSVTTSRPWERSTDPPLPRTVQLRRNGPLRRFRSP